MTMRTMTDTITSLARLACAPQPSSDVRLTWMMGMPPIVSTSIGKARGKEIGEVMNAEMVVFGEADRQCLLIL